MLLFGKERAYYVLGNKEYDPWLLKKVFSKIRISTCRAIKRFANGS